MKIDSWWADTANAAMSPSGWVTRFGAHPESLADPWSRATLNITRQFEYAMFWRHVKVQRHLT